MGIIEGGLGPFNYAGDPTDTAGKDGVQTLTIAGAPTAGTITLGYDGALTAPIAWGADNAALVAAIQAGLEGLPTVGAGNVTVAATTMAAGVGDATITFGGAKAGQSVSVVQATHTLDGAGTVTVAETTPGKAAGPTGLGIARGGLLIDTLNAKLYQNTAEAGATPTWTER
jgi:hypothetical protein